MIYMQVVLLLTLAVAVGMGRKLNQDPDVNFIDDPKALNGIDFSRASPGPDGTLCVQRKKYVDKTEKDQLKECFVSNVTQCYYTYVTEYSDGIQEKCEDFYWKTCKIVFKERVFNATSRSCKRPLVKNCDTAGGGGEPDIVCETFFETECNTTTVAPSLDTEPLDVTFCDKIPRKICAPDNCRVEEGPEDCRETTDQSTIEQPIELCDLQPQKHCSQEKISVPRLIPERKCREVEKEICNTQMVNPHDLKKPVFIKYCTRRENLPVAAAATSSSYLPPPPSPSQSQRSYGVRSGPPPPPQVTVLPSSGPSEQVRGNGLGSSPFRLPSSPFGPGPNLRLKREPDNQDVVSSVKSSSTSDNVDDYQPSKVSQGQTPISHHRHRGGAQHTQSSVPIKRSGRSIYNEEDWEPRLLSSKWTRKTFH